MSDLFVPWGSANQDGSFELTPELALQLEMGGFPVHVPDVLVEHFDLQDIGQQRQVADMAQGQRAAVDREFLFDPKTGARLSRHSRIAEIRRQLQGGELLANPGSSACLLGDAATNYDMDIPSGALIMRPRAVVGNWALSFQGRAAVPTAAGQFVQGSIILGAGASAPLYVVDGVSSFSVFSLNSNGFFSVEYWLTVE